MDSQSDIRIKHTNLPAYLSGLLDIDGEVVLVCGKKKVDLYESYADITFETSSCDLTGTPLQFDLNIDETVIRKESRWHRDEKWIMPMKLNQARSFINKRNLTVKDKSKYDTVVCVCDGTDKQRTVVLISSLSESWFTRTIVCVLESVSISYLQNNFEAMRDYHIKQCETESNKEKTQVSCVYELYGSHLNDCDVENCINEIGSILVECNWNLFQFDIPKQKVAINCMLQVIVGHKSSSVFHLYQDLDFLQRCLTEISRANDTVSATLSLNPKEDHELFSDIKDILHSFQNIKLPISKSNELEQVIVSNFTDALWNTLKHCENTNTLYICFKILFDAIENGEVKIQILEDDKNTIIGKMIHNIFSGTMLMPHLSPKKCLELLCDLGIEKSKKYYLKVIKLHDLKIAKEYQDKWNKFSSTEEPRKSVLNGLSIPQEIAKAQFLFHTHILVEFLYLVEKNVFTKDVIKLVLRSAYDKYLLGPMPDTFFNIKTKRLCNLTMSLSNSDLILSRCLKPCTWKIELTSHLTFSVISTAFHYSTKPIFPSAIYNHDEPNETTKQEKLCVIRIQTHSDKGCY